MPRKLLLADDSVTIQKVVAIVFAHEDYQVTAVANGDDAIARARELAPDIVLADVVMPGKDGYEVCAALKSDPATRHIPVLLLAGSFEPFDEARAKAAGFDGHMPKPFESAQLIERVRQLVEGKGAAAPAPGVGVAAPSIRQPVAPAPAIRPPGAPAAVVPPPAPRPTVAPPAAVPPMAHRPVAAPPPPAAPPAPRPAPAVRPPSSVILPPRPAAPTAAVPPPPSFRPTPPAPPPAAAPRPPMAPPAAAVPPATFAAPPAAIRPPASPAAGSGLFPAPPPPPAPAPASDPWADLPVSASSAPRKADPFEAAFAEAPGVHAAPKAAESDEIPLDDDLLLDVEETVDLADEMPSAPPAMERTPGFDGAAPTLGDSRTAYLAGASSASPRSAPPLRPSFLEETTPAESAVAFPTVDVRAPSRAEAAPEPAVAFPTVDPRPAARAEATPAEPVFPTVDPGPSSRFDLTPADSGVAFPTVDPHPASRGEATGPLLGSPVDERLESDEIPADPFDFSQETPEKAPSGDAAAFVASVSMPPPAPAAIPAAAAPTAPAPAPAAAPAAAEPASDGGEAALRAALAGASREVIEKIAWEVVPQLAEVILREHVERLIQAREGGSSR